MITLDSIQIRWAGELDAQALADIYNHYIRHTVITFEEQPVNAAQMRERICAVRTAGLPWLVAVEGERVLGYAYAGKWRERSAYRFAVESTVYLDARECGRGIGEKLYRALIDQLRARDIHTVIGGIALPNDASIALHEKLGMHQVAHFREVGYKFDRWIDVGYWQLLLKS